MAVPSMLIVAPSGRTKEEMSFSTPISSQHSLETGRDATEDVDVKAKTAAGSTPLKNLIGLIFAKTLTDRL